MNKSTSLTDLSAAFVDLVASVAPSAVAVHSDRSRSSGFVWRPGLIVTADESLSEEGAVSVTLPGGTSVAAHVVGRDPTTDIALLRVDTDLLPSPIGESPLAVGALVLAVGAEDGTSTAALGVVSRASGPWRSLRGGEIDARIELDLRLPQTAEGGLVIDVAGTAIGMAVFGPRRRVLVIPTAPSSALRQSSRSTGELRAVILVLAFSPSPSKAGKDRA